MKLLELLTDLEPERDTITVDGNSYELNTPLDLTLEQQGKLLRWLKRVEAITDPSRELTDEEYSAARAALENIVGVIVPGMPRDVIRRMKDGHLIAIVEAFRVAAETRDRTLEPQK